MSQDPLQNEPKSQHSGVQTHLSLEGETLPTVRRERQSDSAHAAALKLADAALKQVFESRPSLGALIDRLGHLPVADYAASLLRNQQETAVSEEAKQAIASTTRKLFGEETAAGVAAQLERSPCVNTSDHSALLMHPRRFQGNLIFARGVAEAGGEYATSLAGGMIPMNNSSFPAGVLWEGSSALMMPEKKARGAVLMKPSFERSDFEETREKMVSNFVADRFLQLLPREIVANFGADKGPIIQRLRRAALRPADEAQESLKHILRLGAFADVPPETKDALAEDFKSLRSRAIEIRDSYEENFLPRLEDRHFAHQRLDHQLAQINSDLWNETVAAPGKLAKLVQLPLEDISLSLLKRDLGNPDSLTYRFLFDRSVREEVLKVFEGVQGAWDAEGNGTHFFWAFGKSHRMEQLRVSESGDALLGGKLEIALDPKSIEQALDQGVIATGVFLSFITVLSHGLQPSGGYNQMDYAARMKSGLISIAAKNGFDDIVSRAAPTETDGFVAGPVVFLTQDEATGGIRQGALDTFLREPEAAHAQVNATTQSLTLRDATLLAVPDLYRATVPKDERLPEREALTLGEIYAALSISE